MKTYVVHVECVIEVTGQETSDAAVRLLPLTVVAPGCILTDLHYSVTEGYGR